ncbi:ABC transporter ATP-binding protein [Clostridia bacterium]|nr:ABC transporter ATP-binding protein [Clostridia bacterium]
MSQIEINSLTKTYGTGDGKVEALRYVNLSVNKGDMIAISGTSGSGKSTLLNIIGCLDKATGGQYHLDGRDINGYKPAELAKCRNQSFGFVVQYFALIPEYTVLQNILLPKRYSKDKHGMKQKAIELMEKLSISDKAKKYPSELSGGQCQRTAIARALINSPDIILADEPTGALDKNTSKQIMSIIADLNKSGTTVIIVTHDEHISEWCAKKYAMEDGVLENIG